jgi:tripartite-type tricarboxylate transporter receptor subunit TctC
MKRATINALRAAFLLAIVAAAQAAGTYPSRPIRLIVAFAPGGVADVMGRLVAQALQQRLNQSVVVENKPGGDGLIGMGDAVRAVPDGYTLLVGGFGGQIIPPLMRDDFPFDVRRDLVKIALTAEFGNVLVVNKSLPINSVPDLIAYLKARPGAVNFGSSGRATSDLLAAAMFMLQTGTKMVDVPYAGGGQALSDMMAGSTQVMFPQLPAVLGLINSGQVRALAVTSARRLSQLPDVPTLSESGLSRTLVDAIRNDAELRAKMLKLGVEPIGEGAAQAEAFFNDELVRWKDVIDRAGLKIQP